MPTHKVHMAIANKVNEILKLDNDKVMLGSVLPDLVVADGKSHRIVHFRSDKEGIEGTANPYKFLSKYKSNLKDPVMVGYLIHLLTDKFFNSYIFRTYYIYDEDTNLIGIRIHDDDLLLSRYEIKYRKHRDFYVYDKYLLNNKRVKKFKNEDFNLEIEEIEGIKFDKDIVSKYIKNANLDIDKANDGEFYKNIEDEYYIFSVEELDKQFDLCFSYVLKFLYSLK